MSRRYRHPGWIAASTLTAILLLASALALGALRGGLLAPPQLDLSLGPARLVGNTSVMPLCPQFVPCLLGEPSPVLRVYTLWLFTAPQVPGQQRAQVRRLLALPLGETMGR